MRPKQDGWTIVIVGFWNRMIFLPPWVSTNLFNTPEVALLLPLHPTAPWVYHDNVGKVRMAVSEERLTISTLRTDDEGLKRAEKLAIDVLEALPKTPVSAVGVNFGFVVSDPDEDLLEVLKLSDDSEIGAAGWSIEAWELKRQLHKGERILNLSLSYDSRKVEIDGNFHHQVSNADQARDCLREKTIALRDSLLELLKETHALELERDD